MNHFAISPHMNRNFTEAVTDGVIFGAMGTLLRNHVVQIVQVTFSPAESIAASIFNAAAIGIGNTVAGTAGLRKGEINFKKILVITAALAASAILAPHITKPLSSITGVALSAESAITLAAFHGALKAITYAAYHIVLYVKSLEIPTTAITPKQAGALSWLRLDAHYEYFKNQPEAWVNEDFHTRVVLNKRFHDEGYETLLPFDGFTDVNGEVSTEHLKFLHEQTNSTDLTKRELSLLSEQFYSAGLPPQQNTSNGPLPLQIQVDIHALEHDEVDQLSVAKLKWFHAYFHANKIPANETIHEALSTRFIEEKMLPPNKHFVPLTFQPPKNLSNVRDSEKYLLGWCLNRFIKKPDEFSLLSVEKRLEWRKSCREHLGLHIPIELSLGEVEQSSEQAIEYQRHFQKKDGRHDWNRLDFEVQKALIAAFKRKGRSPLQLFPQTAEDLHSLGKKSFVQFLNSNPEYKTDLTDNVKAALEPSNVWKYALGVASVTAIIAGAYFFGMIPLPNATSIDDSSGVDNGQPPVPAIPPVQDLVQQKGSVDSLIKNQEQPPASQDKGNWVGPPNPATQPPESNKTPIIPPPLTDTKGNGFEDVGDGTIVRTKKNAEELKDVITKKPSADQNPSSQPTVLLV